MRKHPDADTFVLAHLRRPAEATTRLVFADWLDETGTPSNSAWAEYIRLREQAEREAPRSARDADLQARIAQSAERIRASLTLSARALAPRFESLTLLLPLANVAVRLAGYEVPRPVLDWVPESVARENLLLPLAHERNTLLIATANPRNLDTLQKLEYILNRRVVSAGAEREDLIAAINNGYGHTETTTVDSVLLDYTQLPTALEPPSAGGSPPAG